MSRWRSAVACVLFGAFGCAAGEVDVGNKGSVGTDTASALQMFKQRTAAHAAVVLADPTVRAAVLDTLRAHTSVALAALPALVGDAGVDVGGGGVPEVSLVEPKGGSDGARLLVAYAPAGNEHQWTDVVAFTLSGEQVRLDPRHAPDVPVVVIETHGRLAMQKGIGEANLALQRAGLQRSSPVTRVSPTAPAVTDRATAAAATASPAATAGRWTTRLDSIRLVDDEEPWISGAAEIYAIVSSVVGDNAPDLRIVDMPYLDNDGTTYTPNQIVIDWTDYAFQAANIQLFEHDDSTNYQTLVMALVTAVGDVGSLAGFPVVQAITEIANRVIAAMPAGWFSNDDDYVDSYYTIQKTVTYVGLQGAGRNATVSLTPFFLAPN